MKVDFYDYNGLGYVVDPESDTKIVRPSACEM